MPEATCDSITGYERKSPYKGPYIPVPKSYCGEPIMGRELLI